MRVLCLFGTRPEIIKLAPVLRALERRGDRFRVRNVASSQHTDLLHPFARHFGVRIDDDLGVMEADQTPTQVASRVLAGLEPILARERPDVLLVQGDTTTALAGALAAFQAGVPVAHVEAGLRSGDDASPFPEEMNRRVVSRVARFHFAPTRHNVETLVSEGVPREHIALTGNPVVDALCRTLERERPSPELAAHLAAIRRPRLLVVTTHRRESFGEVLRDNLAVVRDFTRRHADVAVAFPVHPNPHVRGPAHEILADAPGVHLLDPLGYPDFVHLLSRAWLVASDSGGIQEEAPTLGVPLLVLRENTERPEAIEAGVAKLVGGDPARFAEMLEEAYADDDWLRRVREAENPFGKGDSGERIASALEAFLERREQP